MSAAASPLPAAGYLIVSTKRELAQSDETVVVPLESPVVRKSTRERKKRALSPGNEAPVKSKRGEGKTKVVLKAKGAEGGRGNKNLKTGMSATTANSVRPIAKAAHKRLVKKRSSIKAVLRFEKQLLLAPLNDFPIHIPLTGGDQDKQHNDQDLYTDSGPASGSDHYNLSDPGDNLLFKEPPYPISEESDFLRDPSFAEELAEDPGGSPMPMPPPSPVAVEHNNWDEDNNNFQLPEDAPNFLDIINYDGLHLDPLLGDYDHANDDGWQ